MLPPLVAPASVSAPLVLLPPSRAPGAAAAMLLRVLPPGVPARLMDILARCVGELRYGRVKAAAEPRAAASGERQGGGSRGEATAAWERDLVLEACELAVRTLDAARRRLAARAVLAWVDSEAPAEQEEGRERGGEGQDEEEEIVTHLMRLCELRGWLVAARAAAGGGGRR